MSDENPSSGATAKPVIETIESLYPKQEAQPVEKEQVEDDKVEQPAGNEEERTETASEQEDIKKAKANTSKGVQKRLDELTRQREEYRKQAEQALALSAQLAKQLAGDEEVEVLPEGKPNPKAFKSDLEYVEALTDWKLERKLEELEAKREANTHRGKLDESENKVRSKFEDYDDRIAEFVQSPAAKLNSVIEVLRDSDIGPELAYKIATTDGLADELATLPAYRVAAKLASLEDEIKNVKPKAVSKAPPPPGQIKGGEAIADPFKFTGADISEEIIRKRVAETRRRNEQLGRRSPYR
jgi:hypothetical protein